MVRVRELISSATEKLISVSNTPQLDAEVILCNLLEADRILLHIYPEKEISQEICRLFWGNVDKRLSHMPIQYITKQQEFMGFDFYVNEKVLIPRGDTEILVEEAISTFQKFYYGEKIVVLDIGTGSGAIAVSIARLIKDSLVYAIDISPEALEIAAINAEKLGVKEKVRFRLGNIYEGLKADNMSKAFDFIISNPPYIPEEVVEGLSPQVKEYEPRLALAGGIDGLDFYKRIISNAYLYLKPSGWLMFEVGYDQGEEVKSLLSDNGYVDIRIIKDLAGLDRVVIGKNK